MSTWAAIQEDLSLRRGFPPGGGYPPGEEGWGSDSPWVVEEVLSPPARSHLAERHGRGPMEAYHAETRRRRARRAITACAVVGALFAAAVLLLTHHRAGASAASPSPTPAAANRAGAGPANPDQLTVAQVFPGGKLAADGMTFTLVTSRIDTPCALAAHGAFATALTSAGCERVVRATFIDSSRRYAVTAGAAVLPGLAAAQRVDLRKQFGPDIWFTGLNGAAGTSTTRVTRSGGYGYDVVDGRYIVFAFATFSDGRSPTSRGADLPLLTSLSTAFTDQAQESIAVRVKP